MKCYNHPDIEAELYCQLCGKACCKDCIIKINDMYYCNECQKKAKSHEIGKRKSCAGAAILSFLIPGIGQYYNNQYLKGTTFIILLIGLIYQMVMKITTREYSSEAIIIYAFSLFFIWLFSIITAYSDADKINKGIVDNDFALILYWAIILILLGIVLIANNYGIISDFYLYKSWPLVFIVVGLRFIIKIISNKKREVANE